MSVLFLHFRRISIEMLEINDIRNYAVRIYISWKANCH